MPIVDDLLEDSQKRDQEKILQKRNLSYKRPNTIKLSELLFGKIYAWFHSSLDYHLVLDYSHLGVGFYADIKICLRKDLIQHGRYTH